jgi:hypothetical protein
LYFPFLIVAITGKDRYNTCITESLTFDRRMFMVENIMQRVAEQIGCDCVFLPSSEDAGQVIRIYEEAKKEGMQEGYTPVLIVPDEELFRRMQKAEEPAYYLAEYKKHQGKDILDGFLQEIKTDLFKQGEPWEEVIADVEDGEAMNDFIGFLSDDGEMTLDVILAKVPTKHPWEVFAWVPMGGFDECPPTEYIMAIMKYWVEKYQFEPVVITQDIIEGRVPKRPETEKEAVEIGEEQYAFAPDIVEQCCMDATIGQLADTLMKSDLWFFWWD